MLAKHAMQLQGGFHPTACVNKDTFGWRLHNKELLRRLVCMLPSLQAIYCDPHPHSHHCAAAPDTTRLLHSVCKQGQLCRAQGRSLRWGTNNMLAAQASCTPIATLCA